MRVTSNAPAFENRIHEHVDRTARPLYRTQVVGAVRKRTGRYAASIVVTFQKDGTHRSIVTVSSPQHHGQGEALEHGANVGARRGPHMAGDHAIENVTRARWGSVVSQALRRG